MSFAQPALDRFSSARRSGAKLTRSDLIASYEGDQKLYADYVNWWLDRRADFLRALQQYLAGGLGRNDAQLLFTPWPGEPIPLLRDPASGQAGHPVQITTSEPTWWEAFAKEQEGTWFRWAYAPTHYETVINSGLYARSLEFRDRISPSPSRTEDFHAAPNADPERYRESTGIMMTLPVGRLFTVARTDLLQSYSTKAGLTVVHHFPLNEDNPSDKGFPGPFGGNVGYACVDVDRAGPMVRLMEAKAFAHGDPVNIGYLLGSAFSSGFPGYVRQFNRAYLAVPALPSVLVPGADPNLVVRRVDTPKAGTYFYVVNTSWNEKRAEVNLPNGPIRDLLTNTETQRRPLRLTLYPGELRSYHLPR